jgi:putative ABC transport system permease protein
MLFAVGDFADIRIGKVTPEAGVWPPVDGTVVIERSSLTFSGATVGEPITLTIGTGPAVPLPVAGVARDVGLAPGWMEHLVYGFVTPGTLASLGAPASLNELQLRTRDPGLDQAGVRRLAFDVKARLEDTGRAVHNVEVPVPGEHIHAAQMDSLLYTQGAFAAMALVLSCFLVVNLVGAMLAGQTREIGVMKAIGARGHQIGAMYLAIALGLGLAAVAIAVPVAALIGRRYAALKAELLNFDIGGYDIPAPVIALQLAVGALLPVLAAAVPVLRASRIGVNDALRDVGIDHRGESGGGRFLRATGLARPILLSLRNAFRKRWRMALTLLALTSGGAVFLGAMNLRASVLGAVDLVFAAQRYEFSVRLAEPQPADSIEAVVRSVAGVRAAEAWGGARAMVAHDEETTGNPFGIVAPPVDTRLLVPTIEAGRFLQPGDGRALVVNRGLARQESGLVVGARVPLLLSGEPSEWTVVGIVESGPGPSAYAPREVVAAITSRGRVSSVVVSGDAAGIAAQVDLIQRVRGQLELAGFAVSSSQLLAESRRVTEDHLLMVVDFLGVMAWVMILVGGLGLASTMGLAVLERTREIGVLRAIGATHRAILTMVQVEGLTIAIMSWIVAVPLSIPMSVILANAFSRIMMRVPVTWLPDVTGVVLWLGLAVLVSLIACAWPAIRATRVTTAAALSYE